MSTDAKPKGKGIKARKAPAHFTPAFQRWARSHVSSESCAKNGAKGYIATAKKHGPDFAFKAARQWRLDHPSGNEVLMIGVLSRLKIEYEREHPLSETQYMVDFYLPATNQVIEVHSRIHEQFDVEKRRRRDACKRKLLRDLQIPCLFVWDTELTRDVEVVIRKVKRFVGRTAR